MADSGSPTANDVRAIADELEDAPYRDHHSPDAWTEWSRELAAWQHATPSKRGPRDKRAKYRIRAGVPNSLRPKVWPLLANLESRSHELETYPLLLQSMECEYEQKIIKDLARTFPMHPLFKDKSGVGQQKMFNVLKAYAVFDPSLGYCQGMAFLVGILLMKLPEEQTFCMLSSIMNGDLYAMRGMYDATVGRMPFFFYVTDQLLQEYVPEVWEHFKREGVEPSMFATQWFMTIYAQKFPFSLVLRIWDTFLAEGVKIVFRVAVALVHRAQATLLQLDMIGVLEYFRNDVVSQYDAADSQDALMDLVGSVKIKVKQLNKLERDFEEMKRKEAEAEDPVKRLEHKLRIKDAELVQVQSDKTEAEQISVDMRILMLQMEDAKATMVTQLQDALQSQALAEARALRLEEQLRQAGLYTEDYSSAELELQRAVRSQRRPPRSATVHAAAAAAAVAGHESNRSPVRGSAEAGREGGATEERTGSPDGDSSVAAAATGCDAQSGDEELAPFLSRTQSARWEAERGLSNAALNARAAGVEASRRRLFEIASSMQTLHAELMIQLTSEGTSVQGRRATRAARLHAELATIGKALDCTHTSAPRQQAPSTPHREPPPEVATPGLQSVHAFSGLVRNPSTGVYEKGHLATQVDEMVQNLHERLLACERANSELTKELADTQELLHNSEQVRKSLTTLLEASSGGGDSGADLQRGNSLAAEI